MSRTVAGLHRDVHRARDGEAEMVKATVRRPHDRAKVRRPAPARLVCHSPDGCLIDRHDLGLSVGEDAAVVRCRERPGLETGHRGHPFLAVPTVTRPAELGAEHEAVAHPDDPVARRADLGVVGHDHEGLAAFAVEAAEEREHVGSPRRVEVAGRLVAEDEAGPIDERSGDRHALLLAAGELVRAVPGAVGQADEIERSQRRGPAPGAAVPGVVGGEGDVLGGRERRHEVVGLEHEPELAGADARCGRRRRAASRRDRRSPGWAPGVPSRSGWWSSPRTCIRVLLPDPEGPMIATISPASIVTSTPRRASTSLCRAEVEGLAQVAVLRAVPCHALLFVPKGLDGIESRRVDRRGRSRRPSRGRSRRRGTTARCGREAEEGGSGLRGRPRCRGDDHEHPARARWRRR